MKILELMARALGNVLNKLIGLKQIGNPEDAYEFIDQNFQEELGLNLFELLKLSEDELAKVLIENSYKARHIEIFSKILFELSETIKEKEKRLNFLKKSKFLINWVNVNDKTFSLERQNFILKIEMHLDSLI